MWKYPKHPKYPTQFCIGHSGMNGVTGERIKGNMALAVLVILVAGRYNKAL